MIKNDEIFGSTIITDKKIETEMITTNNYYTNEITTKNQIMTSINIYQEGNSFKKDF